MGPSFDNWHGLASSCTQIAAANGFNPPSWENLPIKLMLVVTELNEARAYVHGLDSDPLRVELADATIRVLSALNGVWGADWVCRIPGQPSTNDLLQRFQPIEVILWKPLARICQAVETWRRDNRPDTCGHLEFALRELWCAAAVVGVDLQKAVIDKCKENRLRPYLHGKTRSEG